MTACHELFEMVIDPVAILWAQAADGTEYAYERCDPVEEDTFLVDGLRGFPEAIEAVSPQAAVQTCIVHVIHNSMDFVSWKPGSPSSPS